MPMPKWHEIMRPVLEHLSTVDIASSKELEAHVAEAFSMTDEERAERLKSGQLRLYNRMFWAITDLEKAKYLSYGEQRGTYRITDAGRAFLGTHDGPIMAKDLEASSPSFKAWRTEYRAKKKGTGQKDDVEPVATDNEERSPLETMDSSYREIRDALSDDILQAIMGQSPYFFEHLVAKLLVAMGYGESIEGRAEVTPQSGDEGIDGIVKEDRLGFDSVYYQAKRWDLDRTVGRPDIQAFSGALSGKGASKGLFITTAKFSKGARDFAEGLHAQRIVLVDGKALANLMIDYSVGVSTVQTYEIKSIDSDFFSGE